MKYLLCVLALAVPCISTAAVISASATRPQSEVADKPADRARHRPLLHVRFVLVKAPPEQRDGPHIDFGADEPAIGPLSLSGRNSVPLRADYTNPNAYCWGADGMCRRGK